MKDQTVAQKIMYENNIDGIDDIMVSEVDIKVDTA